MFIVKIHSGLGNQMFQYSFALFLKQKFQIKVLLDTQTDFITPKHRKYELDAFNVQLEKADIVQISKFIPLKKQNIDYSRYPKIIVLIIKLLSKLFGVRIYNSYRKLFSRQIIKETSTFDEAIIYSLNTKKDYYFDGYWHNKAYYDSILPILKNHFKLKNENHFIKTDIIEKILNSNAVSIHIRRGDYLLVQDILPIVKLEYFQKAIDIIKEKTKTPVFFFFSDDIEWVKEKFESSESCFFVENDIYKGEYEDLILMSLCKHNIISNSTYSWWGATLNENNEKIVIAPKQWFTNEFQNLNTNKFISTEWLRV